MKKPASPQSLERINRVASGTKTKQSNIAAAKKIKDLPKSPPAVTTTLVPVAVDEAGFVFVQTLLAKCGDLKLTELGQ